MTEERNYEEEARKQGWRPKDEFNGDPDKWTDAKGFVEKGEKIAGIMKSRLDRQDQLINKLQKDNKEFGEYQRSLVQKERDRAERAIAELEDLRAKAITAGDGQEFTRLDKEIAGARKAMEATPPPPTDDGLDPLAQAWLDNNSWYTEKPKLRYFADGLADELANSGYTGPAFYSELNARVKAEFPEEFQNPRRSNTPPVDGGGDPEIQDSGERTYDNLPPDAKAACDRFVASGLTSKKDYVANYDWED